MATVHCTLYAVHCILYAVRCTLYTVHCTLYTEKCVPVYLVVYQHLDGLVERGVRMDVNEVLYVIQHLCNSLSVVAVERTAYNVKCAHGQCVICSF